VNARARRAGRIVEHRARASGQVEIELARVLRRRKELQELSAAARARVEAAIGDATAAATTSSADPAEGYTYRLALAKRLELLLAQDAQARLEEEGCRRKLATARTELRKVEMWRDRLLEADHKVAAALDQKANDEVSARLARES